MPLQYVQSQRGQQQLIHEGYIFRKDRDSPTKTFWKCIDSYKRQDGQNIRCKGRCHTANDRVIYHSDNHNHVPNTAQVKLMKIQQEIKQRAATDCNETPEQIISMFTSEQPESVQAVLPSVPAMKRKIQRVRSAKSESLSPIGDFGIPEHLRKTSKSDQRFLLLDTRDTEPEEPRILVFCTNLNLLMMASCDEWYVDGSFKTAPKPFAQLWTIHVVKDNSIIPTMYALLPERSEETYIRTLEALKAVQANLNPQVIIMGFEHAEVNAINMCFPFAQIRGSFFHLGQEMYRQIRADEELDAHFKNVDDGHEWALNIRKLMAIAFVPIDYVIYAFEELLKTEFYTSYHNILQSLTSYFESTWIGEKLPDGNRLEPKYPHTLWNQYHATVTENAPKTYCSIELWHRAFASTLSSHNAASQLWKILEDVRKEQSIHECKIEKYLSGLQPAIANKLTPGPHSGTLRTAQNIISAVKDYGEHTIIEYLTMIAHNLKLQADL